jgi:hypothetical protein
MSGNLLFILGLVLAAGLVLIPIMLVARVVIALLRERRCARAAEARRITHELPGLGAFSSADGELWEGTVASLPVTIMTSGRPPNATHAHHVQSILASLPQLIAQARAYLLAHDEGTDFFRAATAPTAYRVEIGDLRDPVADDSEIDRGTAPASGTSPVAAVPSFVLELTHPADPDGVYRVAFRSGHPVACGRDD